MSCRLLFESLPSGPGEVNKRAEIIDKAYPDGYCECESVSKHSSSVVYDDEFVHRLVFSPIHITDGKINAAVFTDISNKGFSCDRSGTPETTPESHERGEARVQNWNQQHPDDPKQRSYLGTITARCGDIRSILSEGSKVYAIYDTALAENESHADIFEIHGRTRSQKKMARLLISELFTKSPVKG